MTEYTKKQAVAIIVDCAEKYRDHLNGNTILYILRDKHQRISAFEVSFHPYNFLRLTGIKLKHHTNATDFYERCLNHKLSADDFLFAEDGTTSLKLQVLPYLMTPDTSAKMAGDYNGCIPKLYTEKLTGGVKACLGFVKTKYHAYVPNTVLNIDIRTAVRFPLQVIAVYRKKQTDSTYTELVYKARKIDWGKIAFPDEYRFVPKPESN